MSEQHPRDEAKAKERAQRRARGTMLAVLKHSCQLVEGQPEDVMRHQVLAPFTRRNVFQTAGLTMYYEGERILRYHQSRLTEVRPIQILAGPRGALP